MRHPANPRGGSDAHQTPLPGVTCMQVTLKPRGPTLDLSFSTPIQVMPISDMLKIYIGDMIP